MFLSKIIKILNKNTDKLLYKLKKRKVGKIKRQDEKDRKASGKRWQIYHQE